MSFPNFERLSRHVFIGPRPNGSSIYWDRWSMILVIAIYFRSVRELLYATLHNGYADTMEKMLRRLQYDCFYLERRHMVFDFKIPFTTFMNIVFGKKF